MIKASSPDESDAGTPTTVTYDATSRRRMGVSCIWHEKVSKPFSSMVRRGSARRAAKRKPGAAA
jgi:hypothetical protein